MQPTRVSSHLGPFLPEYVEEPNAANAFIMTRFVD
jgi:hypothetical protein